MENVKSKFNNAAYLKVLKSLIVFMSFTLAIGSIILLAAVVYKLMYSTTPDQMLDKCLNKHKKILLPENTENIITIGQKLYVITADKKHKYLINFTGCDEKK